MCLLESITEGQSRAAPAYRGVTTHLHHLNFSSVYVCSVCLTLCDPMDCSPPGSSVHGIIPARILEWFAISSSKGSSLPRNQTRIACIGRWILLPLCHLGSLNKTIKYVKIIGWHTLISYVISALYIFYIF